MTHTKLQEEVVKVLIQLEPVIAHEVTCKGRKNPAGCTCHMFRNAQARAQALDEAGLLRPLKYVKS